MADSPWPGIMVAWGVMARQSPCSDPPVASRAFYSASIERFLQQDDDQVVAALTRSSSFAIETTQRDAWIAQIEILRKALVPHREGGWIAFEYAVPRVGRRIDVLLVIGHALFVLEFKVGERQFTAAATDQVWDYALDLKNFHSTSHDKPIAPILIATQAAASSLTIAMRADQDGLLRPIHATPGQLADVIELVLQFCDGPSIDAGSWAQGRYAPTPTIIEAAMALYGGHAVGEISRSDASAINLSSTSDAVSRIIEESRAKGHKSICFVTGVPGAGKTLVGLNIATQHIDKDSELYSVFLSGNGPLVAILREALARDKVRREAGTGRSFKLGSARSEVKAFIQNVHHFRDDCLIDTTQPPVEHVALFDEAQRAWNLEQTASFMLRKKKRANFAMSEPAFLVSCMDRHKDWAVVVCLVGGGQEINTGEAGIGEWIRAVQGSFPHWQVHLSPNLEDAEYTSGEALRLLDDHQGVHRSPDLHLAVSMRSFRAERVSTFVKQVLDCDESAARQLFKQIRERYPIALTRNLQKAKAWLKSKARGSERYGIVVSSQAQRLKPHAIDVRAPVNPINWFLDPKEDVRSSYYLEDVATEFHVQGLELDWACVVWDGDFRRTPGGWRHCAFRGNKWQNIKSPDRQTYLKNAYRVLLTRARQGMVIVIPEGDDSDPTRCASFYDATFEYLHGIGLETIT